MPGTLTISGASQGLVSGGKTLGPATMTGTANIGEIIDATLASGDNTFAIPAGAVAVMVGAQNPPAAAVKIRTDLNSTDSGLPIAPASTNGWYVVIPLATGATELIFNAGASIAQVELSFI